MSRQLKAHAIYLKLMQSILRMMRRLAAFISDLLLQFCILHAAARTGQLLEIKRLNNHVTTTTQQSAATFAHIIKSTWTSSHHQNHQLKCVSCSHRCVLLVGNCCCKFFSIPPQLPPSSCLIEYNRCTLYATGASTCMTGRMEYSFHFTMHSFQFNH